MVTSLTKSDALRRRNYEMNPIAPKPAPAASSKSSPSEPGVSKPYPGTTRIPSGTTNGVRAPIRPANSGNSTARKEYPPILPPIKAKTVDPAVCYQCGKTGHFKKDCPLSLHVIELGEEDEN